MVRLLSERINAILQQYTRRSPSSRPSTCPCPLPRPKPYTCCDACPASRTRTAYPVNSTRPPRQTYRPTDVPYQAKAPVRYQTKAPACPNDFPCPGNKQLTNRSQTVKRITCPTDVPCPAKYQTKNQSRTLKNGVCPKHFPCPAKKQTYKKNNVYPFQQQTFAPFYPCPAKWQTNLTACSCPAQRKTCPIEVPCPGKLSTLRSSGLDTKYGQYGNAANVIHTKPKCGSPNCFPRPSSPVRNRTTLGSYSTPCPPPQVTTFPTCIACVLSPAGGPSGKTGGPGANRDGCPLREVEIRGDGEHKKAFIRKSWPGDVGGGSPDRGKGEGECHCVADTVVTRGEPMLNLIKLESNSI